jgi:tetratricopeptide (TPR) repeat protein
MTEQATFVERLFTIPSVIFYYLKMLLFPVDLANAWYWVIRTPTFANFGLPLFFEFTIFILMLLPLFFLKEKQMVWKPYFFFLCIFLISFSLCLQIIPLYVTVSDRWFYMPLLGFLGLVGVLFEFYYKKLFKKRYIKTFGIVILVSVLGLFSIRDFMRNFNWSSSYTLCEHDAKINTQSFLLEYCLANELYNIKQYSQAQVHAQKAINLFPKYFSSWYTAGKIYYAEGDKLNAQKSFEKSLAYNDFAYGSEELALVLVYQKKPQEAKAVAQNYLKKLPNSTELWYALALAEYTLGNSAQATEAAKRAYELEPTPISEKVYLRLSNNLPIKF